MAYGDKVIKLCFLSFQDSARSSRQRKIAYMNELMAAREKAKLKLKKLRNKRELLEEILRKKGPLAEVLLLQHKKDVGLD